MRRIDLRLGLALLLGLGGLAAAALLIGQEQRSGTAPTSPPVELGAATPRQLDTLAFRGRRIEVSLGGWVSEVAPDGRVWLGSDAQAFPVSLPDSVDVAVEDRLLVTGRLRGRGGQRWLEAEHWTHVQGMAQ